MKENHKTFSYRTPWGTEVKNLYLKHVQTLEVWQHSETGFAVPWCIAAKQIPGLNAGEVAIKSYAENEGILNTLLEAGIITQPHRIASSGYATFPICYINEETARMYTSPA